MCQALQVVGLLSTQPVRALNKGSWFTGLHPVWQGHLAQGEATLCRKQRLLGLSPNSLGSRECSWGSVDFWHWSPPSAVSTAFHLWVPEFFFKFCFVSIDLFILNLESLETIGKWNEGGEKSFLIPVPRPYHFSEYPSCLFSLHIFFLAHLSLYHKYFLMTL